MSPIATVAAVMERATIDRREVLLTRRSAGLSYAGYWCLPGGHIEPYEEARTAVIREAEEETGYRFDAQFAFYQDEIVPEREIHHLVLVFRGPVTGTPQAGAGEVDELAWFDLEEAKAMDLAFRHHQILTALEL